MACIIYSSITELENNHLLIETGDIKNDFKKSLEAFMVNIVQLVQQEDRKCLVHGPYVYCYMYHPLSRRLCVVVATKTVDTRTLFSFLSDINASHLLHGDAKKLESLLVKYNKRGGETLDPVKQAQEDLDETKEVMLDTLNAMLERGEKLEVVEDNAMDLERHAALAKELAPKVKNIVWWRRRKFHCFCCVCLVTTVVIILIIVGTLLFVTLRAVQ